MFGKVFPKITGLGRVRPNEVRAGAPRGDINKVMAQSPKG